MLDDKHTIQELLIWAGAVGVFSAALCTAIFQLVNGWRERTAADARHMRELALEAAIAEWKQDIEDCKNWQPNREAGQREEDRPIPEFLDFILIKKLKLIQIFGDGSLTVEEMRPKWKEMAKIHAFMGEPNQSKKDEKDAS
jgi:hypothetical protein